MAILHRLILSTFPLGIWGLVFRVAILLSYFGFLRQSNLAPRSSHLFDPSRHTRRRDITVSNLGLHIRLRWTKTLQAATQPQFIPVAAIPGSPLCPVAAYSAMVASVPVVSSKSPLLLTPTDTGDLQVVTIPMLAKQLRQLLHHIGIPPNKYSLHSLRRGGATACFQSGVPVDSIRGHGTWASDCVWSYLQSSVSLTATVPATLARLATQVA
jgi:hypothetical protein